jgi:hypothetical protein
MSAHRIEPLGLSALLLGASATVALAQVNPLNPATTLLNGENFNSIPNTSSTLLPPRSENPVSPALPTGLIPNTTGRTSRSNRTALPATKCPPSAELFEMSACDPKQTSAVCDALTFQNAGAIGTISVLWRRVA